MINKIKIRMLEYLGHINKTSCRANLKGKEVLEEEKLHDYAIYVKGLRVVGLNFSHEQLTKLFSNLG